MRGGALTLIVPELGELSHSSVRGRLFGVTATLVVPKPLNGPPAPSPLFEVATRPLATGSAEPPAIVFVRPLEVAHRLGESRLVTVRPLPLAGWHGEWSCGSVFTSNTSSSR